MKEHELIRSDASWSTGSLPEPLASLPRQTQEPQQLSSLNTMGTARLNGYIGKAIVELAKGPKSSICVISIGDGCYSGEYEIDSGARVIVYCNDKGELKASEVPAGGGKRWSALPEIGNPKADYDTSGILGLYLQMLLDISEEARNDMDAIRKGLDSTGTIPPDPFYRLNDLLQQSLSSGVIKCTVKNGSIDYLTKALVQNQGLTGEILYGRSTILMPNAGASTVTQAMTFREAAARFREYAESRAWSKEEEKRIRHFPDDFIVPDEVMEMADWFVSSRGTALPANNICWRGITGCGKSTGAALLSAILHTPLYVMTCSSGMETADFLSTLVPVTKHQFGTDLPSADDIFYDPAYAYEMLTGEQKESVSSQEALNTFAEACATSAGAGNGFQRVESEYIKALRSGAIVEIQEFSRIKDSGVLVGLNEYDHPGALIPLVDGSYVTRHEDAICLYTDNLGYTSCRPVDPSVMRRMVMVFDTFELDREKVIDRCIYNTGAPDRTMVSNMYEIWNDIREFCIREDITEGDLSPSDLEHWVARVTHSGIASLRSTIRRCIISKVSTDRETQEQIMSGVATTSIDRYFGSV